MLVKYLSAKLFFLLKVSISPWPKHFSHLFQTPSSPRPVRLITNSFLWTTWQATSSPSHPQGVFSQVLIMTRRSTSLNSRHQTPAGEEKTVVLLYKSRIKSRAMYMRQLISCKIGDKTANQHYGFMTELGIKNKSALNNGKCTLFFKSLGSLGFYLFTSKKLNTRTD